MIKERDFFNKKAAESGRMEVIMKKSLTCMLCFILMLSLAGCGSRKNSSYSNDNAAAGETGEVVMEKASSHESSLEEPTISDVSQVPESAESEGLPSSGALMPNTDSTRKLIKNIFLEMETRDYDALLSTIQSQITASGGYVESSESAGSSYEAAHSRYTRMVVRIPGEKLDHFLTTVESAGNVLNKQISTEDVTLAYLDTESRKKALEIQQDHLFEFLEKAETMEEIIALETRLSEIRYELQNYESQLRSYDNLVEYSTVTLNINEVERITPAADKSMWQEMQNGLSETLYQIRDGLTSFAIGLVTNLPYLVILFIIAVFVLVISKKFAKTRLPIGKPKQHPAPPKDSSHSEDL